MVVASYRGHDRNTVMLLQRDMLRFCVKFPFWETPRKRRCNSFFHPSDWTLGRNGSTEEWDFLIRGAYIALHSSYAIVSIFLNFEFPRTLVP